MEVPEPRVESFAPGVVLPGGRTVNPPGWMYILAWTLTGNRWAINEWLEHEEYYKQLMRNYLHEQKAGDYAELLAEAEENIKHYRAKRDEHAAQVKEVAYDQPTGS